MIAVKPLTSNCTPFITVFKHYAAQAKPTHPAKLIRFRLHVDGLRADCTVYVWTLHTTERGIPCAGGFHCVGVSVSARTCR